jgi:hypothetical protein
VADAARGALAPSGADHVPAASGFVPLQNEKNARANQENGPDHNDSNVAESEFLELKGNSEKNQKSAPKPTYRTRMPHQSIHAKIDQDERPKLKDPFSGDETDLVEQQHDAHEKDEHANDEMPVGVPGIKHSVILPRERRDARPSDLPVLAPSE